MLKIYHFLAKENKYFTASEILNGLPYHTNKKTIYSTLRRLDKDGYIMTVKIGVTVGYFKKQVFHYKAIPLNEVKL